MKTKLLILDSVDDRKEVLQSLQRLSTADRLAWLAWCCTQCGVGGSRPGVDPMSKGGAMEVFLDFFAAVADFGLDPEVAAKELEKRARKLGRRLGSR